MIVGGLAIPALLLEALETGRWPRTADEVNRQNLKSLVPEERIQALAPGESSICLYPPPFATVAMSLVGEGANFYYRFGALDQLVPEAAIDIGDFGLGSDAPIFLDYRESPNNPRVIRLCWSEGGRSNTWKVMAPDFPSFMKALGL
ncbi:Putative integron gene cassette protein OS=uncultured bacterium GN=ORF1 PE=4 SV=1 [Gemmata massiliana]|uniref:Knr4/Smi1-like domain-containing protein n=1 Tax=Gemmata massiliana TaxID=1210884 RepID=A0A6P2D5T7_9BACT|nr:hypothetical protein [Gemmata massiliana]VTR96267.1 Putative integron gene cassette protein OS=uncultured bacterium GN=ORF1 PE=4 SV=1 [Gemmata massiliana]